MVVDEVAHVNECMSRAVVELRETRASTDADYGCLEVHFNGEVQKRRELERKVMVAKGNCQTLWDEVVNLQGSINDILFRLADVESKVRDLHLFWAVIQHGQNNPIVVDKNDKTVADLKDERERAAEDDEVEILEEGEVRDGAVFPAGRILVPIEDEEEDPCELSR